MALSRNSKIEIGAALVQGVRGAALGGGLLSGVLAFCPGIGIVARVAIYAMGVAASMVLDLSDKNVIRATVGEIADALEGKDAKEIKFKIIP